MALLINLYDRYFKNSMCRGVAVTPDDDNDLAFETREIRVAGGGNLAVIWADGTEGTHAVAAGERVKWRVSRIKATGTTATGIEAFS